jgi:phosphohistidine phosphatase
MDLILWRHAEAHDGSPDLARELTPQGREDAKRVAAWLKRHLPPRFVVIASPAARAQQTAAPLSGEIRTVAQLAPGASVQAILAAAGWPRAAETAVLVGHQPDFGRAIAYLVSGREVDWPLEKGGFWWICNDRQVSVKAVLSPDLLP